MIVRNVKKKKKPKTGAMTILAPLEEPFSGFSSTPLANGAAVKAWCSTLASTLLAIHSIVSNTYNSNPMLVSRAMTFKEGLIVLIFAMAGLAGRQLISSSDKSISRLF